MVARGLHRSADVLSHVRLSVLTGFFIIFNSKWGKDEPQTLRYAIMLNCSMGADGGQGRHGGGQDRHPIRQAEVVAAAKLTLQSVREVVFPDWCSRPLRIPR
jgi:hypothetical protein